MLDDFGLSRGRVPNNYSNGNGPMDLDAVLDSYVRQSPFEEVARLQFPPGAALDGLSSHMQSHPGSLTLPRAAFSQDLAAAWNRSNNSFMHPSSADPLPTYSSLHADSPLSGDLDSNLKEARTREDEEKAHATQIKNRKAQKRFRERQSEFSYVFI